jgi:hypothetical protein
VKVLLHSEKWIIAVSNIFVVPRDKSKQSSAHFVLLSNVVNLTIPKVGCEAPISPIL